MSKTEKRKFQVCLEPKRQRDLSLVFNYQDEEESTVAKKSMSHSEFVRFVLARRPGHCTESGVTAVSPLKK